jgi:hypothetical protein
MLQDHLFVECGICVAVILADHYHKLAAGIVENRSSVDALNPIEQGWTPRTYTV